MNHQYHPRPSHFSLIGLALAVLVGSPAFAGSGANEPTVKEVVWPDGIQWQTQAEYRSATLLVSGPGGFMWRRTFEPGDALVLDFASLTEAYSPNGQYKYELKFVPQMSAADQALAREARELGEEVDFLAWKTIPAVSGGFMIDEGAVVDRGLAESDALKLVHSDDVSIIGSLCVGIDCQNNPSFGFDTVRLQENNLRVHFNDTSSTASFPDNDWRITINDSSNGGGEYFSIDDASASRQVFRIEAGAPSNSLYVDDGGRLGLGTNQPVVDLQVVSGNTPTLRLQQDGSSGFTPQTWDVAGNEAGFFVRDATGGSMLAFRIRPGADTSSIDIGNQGNIGINNSSPDTDVHLHVKGNKTFGIQVENTGGPARINLVNGTGDDAEWQFNNANGGTLRISDNEVTGGGTSGTEFELDRSGNLTISGDYFSVTCTSPGSPCAPDYVFQEDYQLMPLEELSEFISTNKHLPNVPSEGSIRQAQKINMSTFQMTLLEKIEELTLYTLQQQEFMLEQQQTIVQHLAAMRRQQEDIGLLTDRLEALEAD